jgi:hypothetical protein
MKLLQNLWMLMALLGGLALLLCVTLGYIAMWTERPAGDRLPSRHGLRRVQYRLRRREEPAAAELVNR